MVGLGNALAAAPEAAVALASLFQLTEGCLGRELRIDALPQWLDRIG